MVSKRQTLDRGEWARLRGVDDLARMLVGGWDNGFPVVDGSTERDLIDRLRDMTQEPALELATPKGTSHD